MALSATRCATTATMVLAQFAGRRDALMDSATTAPTATSLHLTAVALVQLRNVTTARNGAAFGTLHAVMASTMLAAVSAHLTALQA